MIQSLLKQSETYVLGSWNQARMVDFFNQEVAEKLA